MYWTPSYIQELYTFNNGPFLDHSGYIWISFIHIRLIKSLTYRKPYTYSNNKAREI